MTAAVSTAAPATSSKLSQAAIARYRAQGYLAPIRALPAAEADGYRQRLEAAEASGRLPDGALRNKSHLLFPWLHDLIQHQGILDAVEGVLGPDILCWSSSFFIKDPRNKSYVSWHQDLTYWGLDPADIVTAWVAISESTNENGAMRVMPGTHTTEIAPHSDTFNPDNLLSRGQEISVEVDASKAVALELQPGEMSLHHVKLIHGSEPNPSDKRRIGYAIRYMPAHVRQTTGMKDSATLVRGVDAFRHFLPEQRPSAELSDTAIAHHAEITGVTKGILMRGTGRGM
jgi:non-haem Fe2+, alpha-ketoglutarate-dependent halogenase